jgi:DnaD/phage-associated family protein
VAGRPPKHTVDWFSHDALASDGRTVTILENHFGAEGYATWFKLLERISRTENHIITCRNTEEVEFLAAKLKLAPERFVVIINKMAELGAIDKDLWMLEKVIWCQNLVDRFQGVYDNRHQAIPHKPSISTDDNSISGQEMALSKPENTQTKVKESKLNKSKEKLPTPTPSSDGLVATAEIWESKIRPLICHVTTGKSLLSNGDEVELRNALNTCSAERIIAAIAEAAGHNRLNWPYIQAILKRWEADGQPLPKG